VKSIMSGVTIPARRSPPALAARAAAGVPLAAALPLSGAAALAAVSGLSPTAAPALAAGPGAAESGRLRMGTALPAMVATTAPGSRSVASAATPTPRRLPHGELGDLPFRQLAFGTRQRRADQATMNGALVLDRSRRYLWGVDGLRRARRLDAGLEKVRGAAVAEWPRRRSQEIGVDRHRPRA
jgi:hypothetical protein